MVVAMNSRNFPTASRVFALGAMLFTITAGTALNGAVITAASGSRADVGTAVAAAVDGDTVIIPAGTYAWSNTLTMAKGITLQGAGIGATIVQDWITTSPNYNIISIETVAGKSYRLSGIQFDRGSGHDADNGGVRLTGLSTAVRLDHCFFNNIANENIVAWGTYGVIDHCKFNLTQFGKRALMFFNGVGPGDSYGDASWQNDVDWGGPAAMYVEDCWIEKPRGVDFYSAFDGWLGGRIVVRHNTIINLRLSNHGTETSQRQRSARKMEIYSNIISNRDYTVGSGADSCIEIRGGGVLMFSNTITGQFNTFMKVSSYRNVGGFPPWGVVDGTKAWDGADLSDGPNTPGGAGDGVFEAGISTDGGAQYLIDSTKNWTTNQWDDYILREVYTNTATSGSSTKLVVTGAGWATNQWSAYEITQVSTGAKGCIAGNTSDTLTFMTSYYQPNFTGGGSFILSRAREITASLPNKLIVGNQTDLPAPVWKAGQYYQIRKASWAMDQPGRGRTSPVLGSPPNHQNLSQALDGIYQWANTWNGVTPSMGNGGYGTLVKNRDYFDNVVKPNYVPYVYPHPLTVDTSVRPGAPSNLRLVNP